MSERMTNGFQRLFEVRLLHHYWLDDGSMVFDAMPETSEDDKRKKYGRLLAYDMRSFLAVRPTAETEKLLGSLGFLFRETAFGFVVVAPEAAVLSADTVFYFAITVTDSRFFDYTALTLLPRTIYDCYYEPEKTVYRYKENVPLLSNLTGSTREIPAGNKLLFLSRQIPAALATDDGVESMFVSGKALEQLTSDNQSNTQQLAPDKNNLPVFLHQGDVQNISPPAGLSGAPLRGVRLADGIANDVFALICLTADKAPDPDFNFIDGSGKAKDKYPVYQVRFKNRSTYWTYLDKITGTAQPGGTAPLPLTFYGNAAITTQKPSAGMIKVEKNGTGISKLVSEIYI